jgi:predicted DCC family thiol-disulfide oxidoreductase YuxK
MKTLKDHLILFDAECPMCRVYTKAFVSAGLLDKDGRAAYQNMQVEACPMLDRQRAVNEIALINKKTGEVSYGIESLFKVFGAALPALTSIFEYKPFIWLMSKIYAFVAYNRRVIVPSTNSDYTFRLQPTFMLEYRVAYLLFTWILTAYILSGYANLLNGLLPQGHSSREYLICGGQIMFQGVLISFINNGKRWDYLGNMMTISFGGALVLIPALVLSKWADLDPLFYAAWFMAVAGLMFLEHIRRSKLLKLGWVLTISWLLYRIIVLAFILLNII